MLRNSKNPSFNLSLCTFLRRQVGMEELGKAAVAICISHPCGYGIGVVLIGGVTVGWEAPAPQGRIHFRHD